MVQIKNIGEVRSKGKVLIYNLIKTPLPPDFSLSASCVHQV